MSEKKRDPEQRHKMLKILRLKRRVVKEYDRLKEEENRKENQSDYREALLKIVNWKRRFSYEYHYMQFNFWPDYWDDDEAIEKEAQHLDEYKKNRVLYMRNLRRANADFEISDTGVINIPFKTYRGIFILTFIFAVWVALLGDISADLVRYDIHIWLLIAAIPAFINTFVLYISNRSELFRKNYKKLAIALTCFVSPLIVYQLIPDGNYDMDYVVVMVCGLLAIIQYYSLIFYLRTLIYLINKDYPPVAP